MLQPEAENLFAFFLLSLMVVGDGERKRKCNRGGKIERRERERKREERGKLERERKERGK